MILTAVLTLSSVLLESQISATEYGCPDNNYMNDFMRDVFVGYHLVLRRRIAKGGQQPNNQGFLGPAKNMYDLKWDCDFEKQAHEAIDQCNTSPRANVSQNIASFAGRTGPNSNWTNAVWGMIGWLSPASKYGINIQNQVTSSKQLNFGNMAYSKSTKFGCGFKTCGDQFIVTCLYNHVGNRLSTELWESGQPCRTDGDCTTYEGSSCDKGLCVDSENKAGVTYTREDEKPEEKKPAEKGEENQNNHSEDKGVDRSKEEERRKNGGERDGKKNPTEEEGGKKPITVKPKEQTKKGRPINREMKTTSRKPPIDREMKTTSRKPPIDREMKTTSRKPPIDREMKTTSRKPPIDREMKTTSRKPPIDREMKTTSRKPPIDREMKTTSRKPPIDREMKTTSRKPPIDREMKTTSRKPPIDREMKTTSRKPPIDREMKTTSRKPPIDREMKTTSRKPPIDREMKTTSRKPPIDREMKTTSRKPPIDREMKTTSRKPPIDREMKTTSRKPPIDREMKTTSRKPPIDREMKTTSRKPPIDREMKTTSRKPNGSGSDDEPSSTVSMCPGSKITEKARNLFLALHNEKRRSIALGKAPNNVGFLGPAKNMYKMEWKCEYEKFAQTTVDSCNANGALGPASNGISIAGNGNEYRAHPYQYINETFEIWANGPQLYGTTNVYENWNNYYFGNIAMSKTTKLGCAYNVCGNTLYVNCVYSLAGNFQGTVMWEKGPACQQDADCTTYSGSTCDNGLCVAGGGSGMAVGGTNKICPKNSHMNDEAREKFLERHNSLRSSLAKGEQEDPLGVNGFAPKAARMRKMVWDCEIEYNSQKHASSCQYAHSPPSARPGLGQNLYFTEQITLGVALAAAQASNSWWAELKTFGVPPENRITEAVYYRKGKEIGHYSQMAWQNSYKLGCGISWCKQFTYVVCEYGPGGNTMGELIYQLGSPCSTDEDCQCSGCKCSKEEALCIMP
ncbi:hypothetical protein Y032_0009g633 [Ancylostoma ceylanicum]|uniref:SCP domain-containing protein n=1 Tax=Ancylostoma ceylanicum TaxID=53326 RepID=A0A016VKJ4_9BILA|nr:hypothetical protein Y032_0009g633 [Ancylostoma ceylanicum]